jgi:hypothetical protein
MRAHFSQNKKRLPKELLPEQPQQKKLTNLYVLFDVPDERAQAELLGLDVHAVERVQQRFHAGVIDYGDDGGVHRRPSMATVMRFTRFRAATLHLFQVGKPATVQTVEYADDALVERLVECD